MPYAVFRPGPDGVEGLAGVASFGFQVFRQGPNGVGGLVDLAFV